MNEITVEIVKLVNGGQGLGFYDGKPVFAWNVLPGETAVIEVTKEKKNYLEGIAVEIKDASQERIDPAEDHFISCSPWQIMTPAFENHWKKEIATETFKKIGGIELTNQSIIYNDKIFGYRNKMEYGFCANVSGSISLAFHTRGTNELFPIEKCLLAKAGINEAAKSILDLLNRDKAPARDLKSLILRESRLGDVVASLFVTNKNFKVSSDITGGDVVSGFQIYFDSPKNHAVSLLHSYGSSNISDEIAGKNFKYGSLSFFQVNLEIFDKTISRISESIAEDDEVVDFYSGVGVIGIALGGQVNSGVLVENEKLASRLAGENLKANDLKNFKAYTGAAEEMLDEIRPDKTVMLNPPRAGLHPAVVAKLLEVLPVKIIYLSCDVATQARDLKMLSPKYEVSFHELYNYFPRTPHTESLLILERKKTPVVL